MTQQYIVKVQLPLESSEKDPPMLVYSEGKHPIYTMVPVQERFAKELKMFPHKGYYRATLVGDQVTIGPRVKNQPW
jgi:hypothetical protein